MDHVWSPWRMKYIKSEKKQQGCIFCDAVNQPQDDDSLIVKRGQHAFVILNRYPYTSGHIMIVPNQHVAVLEALDEKVCLEMMQLSKQGCAVLRAVYQPDGFNFGANLGASAGAGIADHIHFHLVPRWDGDTNFMTSIGGTRVLPEDLQETLQRIRLGWKSLDS